MCARGRLGVAEVLANRHGASSPEFFEAPTSLVPEALIVVAVFLFGLEAGVFLTLTSLDVNARSRKRVVGGTLRGHRMSEQDAVVEELQWLLSVALRETDRLRAKREACQRREAVSGLSGR